MRFDQHECAAIMEVLKITEAVELELGSAGATLNDVGRNPDRTHTKNHAIVRGERPVNP